MRSIFKLFIFCFFCLSVSFTSGTQKHIKNIKARIGVCCASQTAKTDSIPNFSITINGPQNIVTIKTDSLTVKTTETITNKAKAINTIKIDGKNNSVSVSQETKGKVSIKQNGNNNQVHLSQSNH